MPLTTASTSDRRASSQPQFSSTAGTPEDDDAAAAVVVVPFNSCAGLTAASPGAFVASVRFAPVCAAAGAAITASKKSV
jgi:hypothetical protein